MGRLSLLCFSLLVLGSSAQRNQGSGDGGESVKANSQSTNGKNHEFDILLDYQFAGGSAPTAANFYIGAAGPGYTGDGNTSHNTESADLKKGIEQWCHKNGHSHSRNSPGGFDKHGKCIDYHPLGSCAAKAGHLGATRSTCESYEPHNTRLGLAANPDNHAKFVETQGWKNMVDSSRCTWNAGTNTCAANASADCGNAAKDDEVKCQGSAKEQTCVWVAKGFCIPLLLKTGSFNNNTPDLLTTCNDKTGEASCSVLSNHGNPEFNYCIWVDQQASWGDKLFGTAGIGYPPSADFPASRSDYADLPKVCRSNVDTASCLAMNSGGAALANKGACIADSKCDWVGCGNNACGLADADAVSVSCVATEVCDNESVETDGGATYTIRKNAGQTVAQSACALKLDKTTCEASKNCTFDQNEGLQGQCNAIECRSVSVGNCHAAQPNKPEHCKVQRLDTNATAYGGRSGEDCGAHTSNTSFGGGALAATTSQSLVDAQKTACLGPKTTNTDPLFLATGGQGAPEINACEWIEAGKCGDACKSGNDQAGCTGKPGGTCEWIYLAQDTTIGECNPQFGAAIRPCANKAHIGDDNVDNNVGGNGAPAAGTFRLSAFPTGELQVGLGEATAGTAKWYTVCTNDWGLTSKYASVKVDTFNFWCQALGYPLGAHTGNTNAPAAGNAEAGKGYVGTLSACSDTTGSIGATCTSDKNPIDWSSAQSENAACTSALGLTCKGPRGGYKHNVIPGLQADIARRCDFSPIQIAHARVLQVTAASKVTAALRLATKTYCTDDCDGGDADANAGDTFAYFDKGSIQTSRIYLGIQTAYINTFAKGLALWAGDGSDYGFAGATVTVAPATDWTGSAAAYTRIYSTANINSWPLISGANQWTELKKTFAHIDNSDDAKVCTVLNKLAIYTDACPRGATPTPALTYLSHESSISGTYVPAAALDAYINGDRQYYPDKVCNFVKNDLGGHGAAAQGQDADKTACDAAFDCMRDKSGGSATSEEVERCALSVLASHYSKDIEDLMGNLPDTAVSIDAANSSTSLQSAAFSATQWSYARTSGGEINLVNASAYSAAIRDAWLDSFSEHNNWTDTANKLCTSDAVGFRDLLTNTNGANGPRGPFVAGFDQVYKTGGAVTGAGNPPASRSNRYGWENPRCTNGATKYSYVADSGALHAAAGERAEAITSNPTEDGANYGHNYRGPPSICTGAGHTFTYNRTKGGCSGTAAACSTHNADAIMCANAGCTHNAATCEGIPAGCGAHTTKAVCVATCGSSAWSESRATLGTVSSLGQCKRLCRGNIDCQAVTVTSWAPPQSWSSAAGVGSATYAAACYVDAASTSDTDDSCQGAKTTVPPNKHSKICVLCPHTPPATLAAPSPTSATGGASTWESFETDETTTYVRSGRGSSRQMAVYDVTLYAGATTAASSVNLVREAGGRQLRRSLQAEKPQVKVVASSSEVDEEQFQEAMKDVMRANPHLRRFLAEEKVYPQRDEVIEAAPTATTTSSAAAPTGPQKTKNTSNTQSENVKSASEEESMNSASRIITTSMIAIMSLYALLQ